MSSFMRPTQSFNTATSMGRLTLNMLLSFAQFEREVTAECIRDKIAASKCKGLWMGGNAPLGYRPDGRTLKIDQEEAVTVRTLYELYQEHGAIREVKERAEDLGLRSRRRERTGGQVSGGQPFDRGHIHHILSNPIYAGRIRHKGQIYDGQHPAIIDPEVWERVQMELDGGAARMRGTKRQATRSPLAGKLFDETGDRLTPSHSRKNGKRLRYYISRRLVTDRSGQHPDAWRLLTEQLEGMLAGLVRQNLNRPNAAGSVTQGLSVAEIIGVKERLADLREESEYLVLVERVDPRPGSLTLRLNHHAMAQLTGCDPDHINLEKLILEAPFRTRRRGVELKLHLGEAPPEIDQTLIRNIVKARRWLAMIIEGKSFTENRQAESTSKRRVQGIVDLAMLAPEVLDAVATGEQPAALTSDYLIKTGFPAIWSDQRNEFAAP